MVVEMRECRIWPCTSLGFAPASIIHVALEVLKHRQLTHSKPTARAVGLMKRVRMLLSRIGLPSFTDWKTRSRGLADFTTRYLRLARPARVSFSPMKAMVSKIRDLKLRSQTQLSLQDIARQLNPLLRGWIEYYGRYAPSALYPLLRHINQILLARVMRKFKRFKGHKVRASQFLQRRAKEQKALFVHWDIGMTGVFA
jgi:hypothetical protein